MGTAERVGQDIAMSGDYSRHILCVALLNETRSPFRRLVRRMKKRIEMCPLFLSVCHFLVSSFGMHEGIVRGVVVGGKSMYH